MSRPITIGDTVRLMVNTKAADKLEEVTATVLHDPSDTGDSWFFETAFGETIMLNPTSSDWLGMVKVEKTDE